ncbi:histidine kinase [Pseudoalteromonas xiamenensis]|uniref:sensor histidine kinase n=1 Tax=Pseudoalteromonas xiamenensis TaxID=882626 RepID=UPI0027E3BDC9|nr:histidine kinase [Pseudoalteromonas xiamenensis]WMN59509.1 histidine kinase [Pseudoalteromonas xiamenensis]
MRSVTQLEQHLLPALFSSRGVLGAIILIQLLNFILAFSPLNEAEPWIALGTVTLFSQCVLLISLTLLYVSQRVVMRFGLILQCVAITISVVLTTVSFSLGLVTFEPSLVAQESPTFVLSAVFVSILVVVLMLLVLSFYAENIHKVELLAEAKLQALQARMHPHFLFNSLNAAAELTHINAQAAENMLLDLAKLSRNALMERSHTTLEEEIEVALAFVNIEKWRIGERLQVNWDIDTKTNSVIVPCLILQPLIENAIKHGIQTSCAGGFIDVVVASNDTLVTISVSNPRAKQSTSKKGSGIALDNLRARLALFYNMKASLQVRENDNIFKVELTIPRYYRQ